MDDDTLRALLLPLGIMLAMPLLFIIQASSWRLDGLLRAMANKIFVQVRSQVRRVLPRIEAQY